MSFLTDGVRPDPSTFLMQVCGFLSQWNLPVYLSKTLLRKKERVAMGKLTESFK